MPVFIIDSFNFLNVTINEINKDVSIFKILINNMVLKPYYSFLVSILSFFNFQHTSFK